MRRFDCQTVEGISMNVQVNGKVRARVEVPRGSSSETVQNATMSCAEVQAALQGKVVVQAVFVPDRLINLIAK